MANVFLHCRLSSRTFCKSTRVPTILHLAKTTHQATAIETTKHGNSLKFPKSLVYYSLRSNTLQNSNHLFFELLRPRNSIAIYSKLFRPLEISFHRLFLETSGNPTRSRILVLVHSPGAIQENPKAL